MKVPPPPPPPTDSFSKPLCLHCKESATTTEKGVPTPPPPGKGTTTGTTTTTTTTTTEKDVPPGTTTTTTTTTTEKVGVPPPLPSGNGTTTTTTTTTEKDVPPGTTTTTTTTTTEEDVPPGTTTTTSVPPPPQKTEDMVQYCLRGYPLKLTKCHKGVIFKCDGCMEPGFGVSYRCCKTCNFDLHKECFQPPPTLQHPHFPGHTFRFLRQPPTSGRFCDACGKRVQGHVYHCSREGAGSGWDLHPCCTHLPRNIQFSDGAILTLREDTIGGDRVGTQNTKPCFRCNNATLQGTKGVPGWSYVSACGLKRCYVYCMMKMIHGKVRGSPNSRERNRAESGQERLSITNNFMGLIIGGDPTWFLIDFLFQQ